MIKVVELAFAIVTLGLGVSWILFPDVLLEPYTVVAGVGIAVCEIVRRRSSRSSGRGGRGGEARLKAIEESLSVGVVVKAELEDPVAMAAAGSSGAMTA